MGEKGDFSRIAHLVHESSRPCEGHFDHVWGADGAPHRGALLAQGCLAVEHVLQSPCDGPPQLRVGGESEGWGDAVFSRVGGCVWVCVGVYG